MAFCHNSAAVQALPLWSVWKRARLSGSGCTPRDTSPFPDLSLSVASSFILVIVGLLEQKFLILMNYDVSVFSCLDYTFSVPKNSAQTQVIKFLLFSFRNLILYVVHLDLCSIQ